MDTEFLTSDSLEKASSFFRILITRPHRERLAIAPITVQRRLKFREAEREGETGGRLSAANANLSTQALGPWSMLHYRKICGSGLCPWLR